MYISEVLSNVVEPVVDCFEGGLEIISQEEMLAKIDAMNKRNEDWTPCCWWEGVEDDDFVACGVCPGEEKIAIYLELFCDR